MFPKNCIHSKGSPNKIRFVWITKLEKKHGTFPTVGKGDSQKHLAVSPLPIWRILAKIDCFPRIGVKIKTYFKAPPMIIAIFQNQTHKFEKHISFKRCQHHSQLHNFSAAIICDHFGSLHAYHGKLRWIQGKLRWIQGRLRWINNKKVNPQVHIVPKCRLDFFFRNSLKLPKNVFLLVNISHEDTASQGPGELTWLGADKRLRNMNSTVFSTCSGFYIYIYISRNMLRMGMEYLIIFLTNYIFP